MLITLIVLVIVFCILAWMVSIVPLPPQPSFLRSVLYLLLGLVAIVVLLRVTGVSL